MTVESTVRWRGKVAAVAYEARRLRQSAPDELRDDSALDRDLSRLEQASAGLALQYVPNELKAISERPRIDYRKVYNKREAEWQEKQPNDWLEWGANEAREARAAIQESGNRLVEYIEANTRTLREAHRLLDDFEEAVYRVDRLAWDSSPADSMGARRFLWKAGKTLQHVQEYAREHHVGLLIADLKALVQAAETDLSDHRGEAPMAHELAE